MTSMKIGKLSIENKKKLMVDDKSFRKIGNPTADKKSFKWFGFNGNK